MKNIIQSFKILILAAVLSVGLSYVYAWTAPLSAPTTGNVAAPINTSGSADIKTGNLTVNALGIVSAATNALVVNGGIQTGPINTSGSITSTGKVISGRGAFSDGVITCTGGVTFNGTTDFTCKAPWVRYSNPSNGLSPTVYYPVYVFSSFISAYFQGPMDIVCSAVGGSTGKSGSNPGPAGTAAYTNTSGLWTTSTGLSNADVTCYY